MKLYGVNVVFATFPSCDDVYGFASEYVEKLRDVAEENNIPLLDLRKKHLQYIDTFQSGLKEGDVLPLGLTTEMNMTQAALKEYFGSTDATIAATQNDMIKKTYNGKKGDFTHYNMYGAQKLTKLAMEALCESDDENLSEMKSFLKETFRPEIEEVDAFSRKTEGENIVKIEGTISEKPGKTIENATVVACAYEGGALIKTQTADIVLNESGKGKFDCEIEGSFTENTEFKMYVLEKGTLRPLQDKLKVN